jgi:hypothetical protein
MRPSASRSTLTGTAPQGISSTEGQPSMFFRLGHDESLVSSLSRGTITGSRRSSGAHAGSRSSPKSPQYLRHGSLPGECESDSEAPGSPSSKFAGMGRSRCVLHGRGNPLVSDLKVNASCQICRLRKAWAHLPKNRQACSTRFMPVPRKSGCHRPTSLNC